jgi:hypothetical protein
MTRATNRTASILKQYSNIGQIVANSGLSVFNQWLKHSSARVRTRACTRTHTCMHTHTVPHTCTNAHARTRNPAYTHTHALMRTRARARTHTTLDGRRSPCRMRPRILFFLLAVSEFSRLHQLLLKLCALLFHLAATSRRSDGSDQSTSEETVAHWWSNRNQTVIKKISKRAGEVACGGGAAGRHGVSAGPGRSLCWAGSPWRRRMAACARVRV